MRRLTLVGSALLAAAALACADAPPTSSEPPVGDILRETPSPSPTPASSVARTIYGLDDRNTLVVFDADRPEQLARRVAVTGVTGTLTGIDFRPNDSNPADGDQAGLLYAVSTTGAVYTLDLATGAATQRATLTAAAAGAHFGIGFNPAADRLRVHSDAGQNLRINVETGATVADTALAYAPGDVNAGRDPDVVATAYTNSVAPAPAATQLFAVDARQDALVRLDAPNGGRLTTVGRLGVDTDAQVGFDVPGRAADRTGYATLTPPRFTRSFLYRVNLDDASRQPVAPVGHDRPIISLAIDDRDGAGPGGPTAAVQRVAAGSRHGCALDAGGQAHCWGDNRYGELGNPGVAADTVTPVRVVGATRFASITANVPNSIIGPYVTCGLAADGAAYCWGSNLEGALGAPDAERCPGTVATNGAGGPTLCNRTPTRVASGRAFASLSVGRDFLCGVARSGEGLCWGNNANGQLGTGTAASSPEPQAVAGGRRWAVISAGESHACGLTDDGEAYCWGANSRGQLGDGSTTGSSIPVGVRGGLRFTAVAAGSSYSCALAGGGQAYCWGTESLGRLGNGASAAGMQVAPAAVLGGLAFSTISTGIAHTCAVTAAGQAYCWGAGAQGELGTGQRVNTAQPVPVAGGLTLREVSAGGLHSCAATAEDRFYCWGDNALGAGQLGIGTRAGLSPVPAAVALR